MRRRDVLSTLALLPLAGCVDSGAGGGGGTTTVRTVPTTDTTTQHTASPNPSTTTDGTPPETTETDWQTSFEPISVECGTQDAETASVSFHDEAVTITGTTLGTDLCWLAQPDRVTLDESTGDLVVVIRSKRESDADTCAQCIAAIRYRMTVTFAGPMPDSVTVVHARNGTETTITQATR